MLRDHSPVCPVCNIGVTWPNGWMDQDATWCGGRPRPRPHCVRWDPACSRKGAQQYPRCWPISIVAKRYPTPAAAELYFTEVSDLNPTMNRPRAQSPQDLWSRIQHLFWQQEQVFGENQKAAAVSNRNIEL